MDYEKTGHLVAERRHHCGLTQMQLAEKLNVSNRTISKWERGVGFPDVSLLEPLADALGISIIELIRGELENIDPESDMQVREAVRIVGGEVKKQLRRIWRAIKLCFILSLFLFLAWRTFEFLATNGDGFNPFDNARVVRQGYESNCRSLSSRGVFKIEVISKKSHFAITDPDAITRLVEILAKIDVGKEYRDWGPKSLEHSIIVHASGYTPSDHFIDTYDYAFELTFPAFSAESTTDMRAENDHYYQAEIDDEDAWDVIEATIRELPIVPAS